MGRRLSEENRVLTGRETFRKTVRSRFGRAEILPIVPIPVFLILFLVLAILDIRTVFEPSWILPISNVLFLFIVPLAVVYIATQGYLQSGFITLLMLGAGTLALGLGAVLAGWVLTFTGSGPNTNVTVFNLSALSSAMFHFLGAVIAFIGVDSLRDTQHKKLNVRLTYLGIAILLALLTIGTLKGLVPVFFVQGEGPTVWRQTVLGTAIALFIVSGLLFAGLYLLSRAKVLYWYLLALFLIATGLICVLFQKSVGSPIGWLGRGSQYLGGIYLLVAVVSAWRELHIKGLTIQGGIADLFRHRLAMLVEERTFQLRQANEQLFNEVSERKRAEDALHKSELMLRTILSTSPVGIALTKERRIEWANEAWRQMFGFEDEHEYLGKDARMLYLSDEEYEHAGTMLYQDIETGRIGGTDTKFRRIDGSVFDAHVKMKALDPLYPAKGTISAVSDITSRKRTEEALKESEEKFRNLFNNVEVGMFRTTQDGSEILDVNEGFLNIYGYTREEILSKPSVIHWVDPREREEMVRRLNTDGRVTDFECKMLNKQGEVRTCITSLKLYREQAILEGSIIDITERRQAEEILRRTGVYNRSLIETSLDPLVTISAEGKITDVNKATEWVTGYSRDELIGTDFADYFTDPQKAREGYQRAFKEGMVKDYELQIRHRDGDLTAVMYNASVYHDRSGEIVGAFCSSEGYHRTQDLRGTYPHTFELTGIRCITFS